MWCDVNWQSIFILTPIPQESWKIKTLSTNESALNSQLMRWQYRRGFLTYRTFGRMLWSRWKWDRSIHSLRSVSGRRLYFRMCLSMNLKGVCLWDFMVKLIDWTYVSFDVLLKSTSPSKRTEHERVIVAELEFVRKFLCLQKKWKQRPSWLQHVNL